MKKIFLMVFLALCIFQMIVLAIAIDIGSTASDRGSYDSWTNVNMENPANASGTITSIEIWAYHELTACEVATFYVVSGNNLSTRDTVLIGAVTAGSKQTFTVDTNSDPISLEVEVGDYIGIYAGGYSIEYDSSGGSGVWSMGTDQIPCTDVTFNVYADDVVSVYGTGATPSGNAVLFGFNF